MTRADYTDFQAAVEAFFVREGVTNLSRVAEDEDGAADEFFSWRACDCCGSTLGGSRVHANGYNPTTKAIQEYDICTDCEYYVEYGQLDDQTMLDLDREEVTHG